MFSKLIRFLGGYTLGDVLDRNAQEIKKTQNYMKHFQFRVGDQVYVNNKEFDPRKQYYLLEPYNGLQVRRWYISLKADDKNRNVYQSAAIEEISHAPIPRCITCHQILTS